MRQNRTATSTPGCAGLVLPGGGARGAYQVGVLKAISDVLDETGGGDPVFPVVTGTSAGAINAAVIASHANSLSYACDRLDRFWRSLHCHRIYRTDAWTIFLSGLRWMLALSPLVSRVVSQPHSILDTRPLFDFLSRELRLHLIAEMIDAGNLRGLAITASGYTCASAISFFQASPAVEEWRRPRRQGRRADITVSHLLASAALPFLFPAYCVGNEYFGDGGMRQLAPLSPAIHLGANRLLVVTTRDERPDPEPSVVPAYPTLGEVGGYLLDTIFMDRLTADLARLHRINQTLSLFTDEQYDRSPLRSIDTLVVRPSEDLRYLTARHVADIPRPVRLLLRTMGGWGRDWRMASYLLFEPAYCGALIDLGYRDGLAMKEEIRTFFAGPGGSD